MGGEGGGTNPEQLFAVGYAACFESALGVVARREHIEAGDVSIRSRVSLLPSEERSYKLAVELDVTLPLIQDIEQAAQERVQGLRDRMPFRGQHPRRKEGDRRSGSKPGDADGD